MTSQVSQNKGISMISLMKEDLSHRKWMLLLSCVVQLFGGPIAALYSISEAKSRMAAYAARQGIEFDPGTLFAGGVTRLYTTYFPVIVLVIAVCGALIVGMGGFRHLFNRRMTDMINSIPVKRGKMFASIYLNGFLIWFVPFVISGILTTLVVGANLAGPVNISFVLTRSLLITAGAVLAFFSVYDLIVLSMALSGTVMNAIANILFIGFDVLAVYGIWIFLCEVCFQNYAAPVLDFAGVIWTSAPVSGCTFGYFIAEGMGEIRKFNLDTALIWISLILTILVAAVNLLLALRIYTGRKSEESEAGGDSNILRLIIRVLNSVLAGLFVSVIVRSVAGGGGLGTYGGWGAFFAAFFCVLTFGFIDSIQSKSIRRFFAHKLQMIISAAVTVAVFLAFALDLTGFDNRIIPERSIREAYVRIDTFNGWNEGRQFVPVEGVEGFIIPVYDTPGYDWNDYNMEPVSPELAYRIITAEKYYWADSYGMRGYFSVDPVTGNKIYHDIEENDMFLNPRYCYLDVTRTSGLHFRRDYRIMDHEIAADIYMSEGFMESHFPIRCGAMGYPANVTFMDLMTMTEYIIPIQYQHELMDAYYEDFKESYSVDYIESDDVDSDIVLNVTYYIQYDDGDINGKTFELDIRKSDTRTLEILERLSEESRLMVLEGVYSDAFRYEDHYAY